MINSDEIMQYKINKMDDVFVKKYATVQRVQWIQLIIKENIRFVWRKFK